MHGWLCASAVLMTWNTTASAEDGLLGRWEGRYSCNAIRNIAMVLTIKQVAEHRVSGDFEFRRGATRGSYAVAGALDQQGMFNLDPTTWLKRASRFEAISLQGRLTPSGDAIEGKFPACPNGSYRATRASITAQERQPAPASQRTRREAAPSPLPSNGFRSEAAERRGGAAQARPRPSDPPSVRPEDAAWATMIRGEIARLVASRETQNAPWRAVGHKIVFSNHRANPVSSRALMVEFENARAGVRADILIDELASAPARLSDGALGRVLRVVNEALASKWPPELVKRVREAARARATDVSRPELQAAASLAPDLPATLEGLAKARAALAPIESYRAALVNAFGTIDPEGILVPLRQRIDKIEADPAVAAELRRTLAEARREKNPRAATEQLLTNVFGVRPPPPALATIVAEGRELAALAAITVESRPGTSSDPHEPSARDVAAFAAKRAAEINRIFAALKCKPGPISDPIIFAKCGLGNLEVRMVRVIKERCLVETPAQQFLCEFRQDVRLVNAHNGEPVPIVNLLNVLSSIIPGGYPGEVSQGRFVRRGATSPKGWTVSWGRLQVAIDDQQ